MGGEFGQRDEWTHDRSLDWHLVQYPPHQGLRGASRIQSFVRDEPPCMTWTTGRRIRVDRLHDADSALSPSCETRPIRARHPSVVCNFTPVVRQGYLVGVPYPGFWREILNSDAAIYGGSGCGNLGGLQAGSAGAHGRPYSLSLTLPPLAALFLRHEMSDE